ncbi:50S ribosomal protein L15 [Rhizobium rhizosphaerae]|uniref:Large ribosomal subunit protein uL15 n=1 Tax=Xaviernesmea rhizosphaerae TaxID=1672749 RepID=A0ABX3PAG8_9HYPH|nr:50S ribosomal protein L15 [Xaviernesmea rhizosphaerae]OQP85484.1 50S ribosomal protein L15 [Xaviernesmea rhizosphaerae]
MKLNDISDNEGATKNRKRVGRGIGSGSGKTGGRGVKGQKARSGVAINGFEGGQMPIYRRLPKRGFNNIFREEYVVVSLGRIQTAIDAGKLDAAATIDADALKAAGVIRRPKTGVRVLADGELTAKVSIQAVGASKAAVEKIEKAGGTIVLPAVEAADAE